MFLVVASTSRSDLARFQRHKDPHSPLKNLTHYSTHSDAIAVAIWSGCIRKRERWSGVASFPAGDDLRDGSSAAELIDAVAETAGTNRLATLRNARGPFGVAVWSRIDGSVLAARDHFGLQSLFYSVLREGVAVSDKASLLSVDRELDEEYAARYLTSKGGSVRRSAWSGVVPVPAGRVLSWNGRTVTIDRFWFPERLAKRDISIADAADQFQALLKGSVKSHIQSSTVWSHLSGGLDSSSIVAVASDLSLHGEGASLAGTLTLTDSMGNGDESTFSDVLIRRFNLRNLKVSDDWPWRSDALPLPMPDQPYREFAFYARQRRIASLLSSEGATSLLSGIGPDLYLPVTTRHIADLAHSRHWRATFAELLRWSQFYREPVWRVAASSLLHPVTGYMTGSHHFRNQEILGWFTKAFQQRHDIGAKLARTEGKSDQDRRGTYDQAILDIPDRMASWMPSWFALDGISIAHPFLDVRLFEFCFQLPWHLKTSAGLSKPVLRRAMRGLLPEDVRLRPSKGTIDARLAWALVRERDYLNSLMRQSIMAGLGWIEPAQVLKSIDTCTSGKSNLGGYLLWLFSLEMWLSARSGRQRAEQQLGYSVQGEHHGKEELGCRNGRQFTGAC